MLLRQITARLSEILYQEVYTQKNILFWVIQDTLVASLV